MIGYLFLFVFHCSAAFAALQETLDFAFSMHELVPGDEIALSPDVTHLSYSVREMSAAFSEQKFLQNRAPFFKVGSRITLMSCNSGQAYAISDPEASAWGPSWSPDSSCLAFYSDAGGGNPALWLYDVAKKSRKMLCSASMKATQAPVWSPDGAALYALVGSEKSNAEAVKEVTVKVYPYPQKASICNEKLKIASFDLKRGTLELVVSEDAVPPPTSHIAIAASGKWLSYLSERPHVGNYLFCKSALAIKKIGSNDAAIVLAEDLVFENNSKPCFAWHPVKDMLVYVKKKKIYCVAFDENEPVEPRQLVQDARVDFSHTPLMFSEDGASLVAADEKHTKIFVIPVENGAVQECKIGGDFSYVSTVKSDKKEGLTLHLRNNQTGASTIVRFDPNKSTPRPLWEGMGEINWIAHKGKGSNQYCCYEDFKRPVSICRFHHDFSKNAFLLSIEPKAERIAIPELKILETEVTLSSGEKKRLKTCILLPRRETAEVRLFPGLVLFYPGERSLDTALSHCGGSLVSIPNFLFLQHGYALVFPDTPLGQEGVAANPLQETCDLVLPQIKAAVDAGLIDGNRLGVIGQSYGGYATVGIIAKTNQFKAAVSIGGVYDLVGNYGYLEDDNFAVNWYEHGQGRMGTHPWDDMVRYINNSPYHLAANIRTPLLLIHGEKDLTCRVQEAEKMFTALSRLGREAQLAVYENENHWIQWMRRPNAIDATRRILDFFDRYLKNEDKGR